MRRGEGGEGGRFASAEIVEVVNWIAEGDLH